MATKNTSPKTITNNEHDIAVEKVKLELEALKIFSEVSYYKSNDADLIAKKDGKVYYFAVIKNKSPKGKTTFSAVSSHKWIYANKYPENFFFIAAIEDKTIRGKFRYYCYTPSEMWQASYEATLTIKCNLLKEPLHTIEDTLKKTKEEIQDRYSGLTTMQAGVDLLCKIQNTINELHLN